MTKLEWLEQLSNTNTSSQSDDILMSDLMHKFGFPNAVVTCGIVYPDGYGETVSIHAMAGVIFNQANIMIKS